jgi:hypothetical protein
MNGHGEKVSRRMEEAIAALLVAPTVEGAAGLCGVSLSTLKRWMALPTFKSEYAKARASILERTVARLLAATGESVATLERNRSCGKPADEIRAATAILKHALHGVETLDLAEQLAELQRQVQEIRNGARPRIASVD